MLGNLSPADSGIHDPQDAASAAHAHALAQRDFRWHPQRELNLTAFRNRRVSKQEHAAGAEILRESGALSFTRAPP